jgi:hypothetical protein
MREDPVYRQNQRDSNQTWQENNPDYWKNYRKKHPEKAAFNRLKQQIRNKRKKKDAHPVAKADLKKTAKMALVDRADELQGKDLWLISSDALLPPIKFKLLIVNKPDQAKAKKVVMKDSTRPEFC